MGEEKPYACDLRVVTRRCRRRWLVLGLTQILSYLGKRTTKTVKYYISDYGQQLRYI